MPYNPLKINRSFVGICRLHLQVLRIRKAKNQRKVGGIHAGVLLGLFFYPEDGGDMFHRNVS
jgi:hypothetical protein